MSRNPRPRPSGHGPAPRGRGRKRRTGATGPSALDAVVKPRLQVAVNDVIPPLANRPPNEVEVRAAGVLLESGAQREVEALLQLRRRLGAGEHLDRAEIGERVDAGLGGVEPLPEGHCLGGPRESFLRGVGDRVQMTEVDVCHRQFAPGRRLLQAGDGLPADLLGLLRAAEEAIEARERAQAVTLGSPVREPSALHERALLRRDRVFQLTREIALVGATLEQRCPLLSGEGGGKSERSLVMGSCLPVRTQRRGALGRWGRPTQHRPGVSGARRVVRQPVQVGARRRDSVQLRQGGTMQSQLPVGCERLLDGQPSELVPERHALRPGLEHSRRQALLEIPHDIGGDCLQQPKLGMRRDDGDRLEQSPGGG